jgi:hypothetical protein
MSGSKFRLPSGSLSRRSPELLPAVGTVVLLLAAGLQVSMPSAAALPEESVLAPRPAPEPAAPATRNYPAALARPIFAPDRAPVLLQAQTAGSLNGYEIIGTAVAGPISAALVRDATGRILRVKPDAVLQGWRVVSIDRTQMILDREGERRSLTVTAAPARAGAINPQLAATQQKSSDSDDEDDSDSSNKSDSDDDDDN